MGQIQTRSMSTPSSLTRTELLRSTTTLFKRLRNQFGPKFAAAYSDMQTAMEEWAAGLADFTPEEIERGMAACRHSKGFVPSLGEFAHWCRPVLDPEIAWAEAINGLVARERGETGQWSHPAVYRAAMRLSYDMRRSTFAAMRRRWEVALQDEFAKGWGDDVPPVAKQIEHRMSFISTPAVVRDYMASIGLKPRG